MLRRNRTEECIVLGVECLDLFRLSDIRRGLLKGQGTGLFLSIGPQFRELGQPDGTIGFSYDGERTLRIV